MFERFTVFFACHSFNYFFQGGKLWKARTK